MSQKNIADIYPLSPLQQGMLFHSLYAPHGGGYIIQMSYEIEGILDKIAFEQAWQQVINRHSILRTAFVWEKLEQPLQVVGRSVKVRIEHLDWRNSDFEEQLEEFLQQQRYTGFNLSKAPLMRLTLIQKAENVYQFIWCYHHLLLDGWSVPLLIQEFLAFYQGKSIDLEPRPYRDYIAWLQKQLGKAERFWKENLQGFTVPTFLNSTHHTESQEPVYKEQQYQFSPKFTTEIQTFARLHQLTLNTIIQGAWALLLSCYSGEDDVLFGTTVSGRPTDLAGSEGMIGLFINTLPVRVIIPLQTTVLFWLKQLQNQQIERQQYEYSSLVDIHRVSDVPRNLPLFESLVIFENYPIEPTLLQSFLEIRNIQTTEQTNFPLTLYAMVNPQLTLRMLYEDSRFTSDDICRMMGHLETILFNIVRQPEQPLSEISLLTPNEQQFLREWNNTHTKYPQERCFHQLFEQQVEKTPDAIAVVFEQETLTYRELNEKANQLAQYLLNLGVKSESIIGIYLERSLLMVITLLGILKSGSVYVPLDPTYPKERITFMIEDSGCSILITQEKFLTTLPHHSAKIICVDKDWEIIQPVGVWFPNPISPNSISPNPSDKENLAYIIYTSGSTGQPKGVQILHKALVNFLTSMQQTLQLTENDSLLSVTTLSFDIAALELFLPLIVGAKVVLVSREVTVDGIQLQEILKTGITIMQATPATWRLLLESGWMGQDLKVLCGGEALDSKLAEQLLKRSREVWNLYGPTETTIWSSVYRLNDSSVYLGSPIANTEFYVLDKHLKPVPIGVTGELYIGGEGLMRGYLNRPDLTALKLVPHPFFQGKDAPWRVSTRLYKTGDLVRYTEQGKLEYLGRSDYQVKLRGFRIELAEIEAILNLYSKIKTSVVVMREDNLVAYLVACEVTVSEVRDFLAEKLPPYMIPSSFVFLDGLPLTPNGKIDRKALPTPEKVRPEIAATYIMPQTEIERTIAQIWQTVLQLEKVGIHDNFFELGGHSLLMVRVHSLLKEQFATEMTLVDLFRYPTISSLAEYFRQTTQETPSTETQQQREAGKQRLHQRRQQREMMNQNG
ncbi:non-ribosomal peptide synthase [Aphanothece hegewaldii CCALA 016]|uniref:Non-ribosomal peptide synthase n=1 Tax=Aphanothece hegewaldii CCALA 016 TaxID=2107694 RepID=A0A2T1LYA4_9CHRO|nr:non-ribosomal peptide synthetase [Aphanothece hegewaldii]PSF37373.1 non-ribosomal peptide synthase [Aphanothece hegewaldii CCALA 016]